MGTRAQMVIMVHFSLEMSRKLQHLAGTYLGMLPGWYEDPDGDRGAIFSVADQGVRDAC
jgi:hypothetical protein